MATKEIVLTKEGHENLQQELKELKEVKRPDIIERIRRAKEFGDLSENAEYQTAKEDQSFIEGRIQELETMLKHVKVATKAHDTNVVSVGTKVDIELSGKKQTFEIVGPTESDPAAGKISSESPIGNAVLGRKSGDTLTVHAPGGILTVKILALK